MSPKRVVCSNCGYTQEVSASALPQQRANATCPKCKHVFVFEPVSPTAKPEPRAMLYGEPLVARYLPEMKVVASIAALIVLAVLIAGIRSGSFVLHLLSAALLPPLAVLLIDCLATQQVALTADRVTKRKRLFGESMVPADKVVMTVDLRKIRFYHGSSENLRERITVKRSMVGQEMFDRLRIAAVSRFDILLKEEDPKGEVGVASRGSGAGKERKVSTLLLKAYEKAVKDYRVALFLFGFYAILMVFIVGLSDDFSGIAPDVPTYGARLAAMLLTAVGYLVLSQVSPAAGLHKGDETPARQDKLTWDGRIGAAKRSALLSSLVVNGIGLTAFLLFLLTGNLLDFYLFMTVACYLYFDFYPRLSVWERCCIAEADAAPAAGTPVRVPTPTRRRSLQVSLVLLGTLAAASFGEGRHYLYKNRKDCLDDWGGNEQDCREPDRTSHYFRSGYWYGPRFGLGGNRAVRAVGATTVSRGGFGSMGSFHASFGG
jgi:hypothetical protein